MILPYGKKEKTKDSYIANVDYKSMVYRERDYFKKTVPSLHDFCELWHCELMKPDKGAIFLLLVLVSLSFIWKIEEKKKY